MVKRKTNSTNYFNQTFLEEKFPLNELLFLLSRRLITEILYCIEEANKRFSGIVCLSKNADAYVWLKPYPLVDITN